MRRVKKPIKLPLSEDAMWLDHLRTECAIALRDWLKGGMNIDRAVRSLTKDELRNMAEAVTSRWIVLVAENALKERPPMSPEEVANYRDLMFS